MYKWYDTLKEPTRFLVFFIPAMLLIVGFYATSYPVIQVISGCLLLLALVTRAIYIHSGNKGGQ
jgi:hypothetical protein